MITKNHKTSQECIYLTPQQQKAIDLLLLGKTERFIAEELEIARETVNRWRNRHPKFIAALNEQQRLLARCNSLFSQSLDVLEQALATESNVKVAIAVVQALSPYQKSELQIKEATKEGLDCSSSEEDGVAKVTALTNHRRLQTITTIPNSPLSSQERNLDGA